MIIMIMCLSVPLLLLSVSSDIVLEEQTLPRDVGRVLSVLVIVELLTRFSSRLGFRVVRRLLHVYQYSREHNDGSGRQSSIYIS